MVRKYDTRKAIKRQGKIVGWRLYKEGGFFSTKRFVGYKWKPKKR